MDTQTLKLLLLIAAIVGIVQGMMTLIGGCVAAEDTSMDSIDPMSMSMLAPMPTPNPKEGKYWCGMIRFKNLVPGKCMPDSMDRGWFKRVYQAVKDDVSGPGLDKDELKKLAGYEAVLSYAIICGVGWMVAGALALVASSKLNKMLALVAGIIFAVLYCLHVALFGVIWDSVARVEDSCSFFYKSCDEIKAQATRSSREFLAYAICAFVLILFSIIICLLFHMKIEEGAKGADKVVSAPQEKIANQEMAVIPPAGVTPAKKLEEPSALPAPKAAVEKKQEAPVSEAAAVADQFGKVNKYLCDDARMEKSAQKKFDAIDNDHSGKVAHAELKKFIAEVLAKKNLPSPDDKRVAALLKKYDKDGSGTLEKGEFKNMLHDIFMSSREALIKSYGAKKGGALKKTRPPHPDASGVDKADALIKDPAGLEAEIVNIAKEVDKDKSNTLNIDEVTMLCSKLCMKFNFPTLAKEEITGVMKDMGREIAEYKPKDLRMACLAVLVIGKTLAKP